MSNKTRNVVKAASVILVLLAVVMKQGYVNIPALAAYTFWMVIIAFGILLITSK